MGEQMFKIVRGERVPMTAAEIAKLEADQATAQAAQADAPKPEPVYKDLSAVEFMGLVKKAGGLSSEQFVDIMQGSAVAEIVELRIMLSMANNVVKRGDELVTEGLETLKNTDPAYLGDDNITAIMAAWPRLN